MASIQYSTAAANIHVHQRLGTRFHKVQDNIHYYTGRDYRVRLPSIHESCTGLTTRPGFAIYIKFASMTYKTIDRWEASVPTKVR